jgi:hypothetical protein
MNSYIGPPNHVDFWALDGQHVLSKYSNFFQVSVFLVYIYRPTPNHIQLKCRCSIYCYVGFWHAYLTSTLVAQGAQKHEFFLIINLSYYHYDNILNDTWILSLMMNETFIEAPRIMGQRATNTIWIFWLSCTNPVFCIPRDVGALSKIST